MAAALLHSVSVRVKYSVYSPKFHSLPLLELKAENGAQVPTKWFNGGQKSRNVFVGSSFAVLVAAFRRKDPGSSEILQNRCFTKILEKINGIDLLCGVREEEEQDRGQNSFLQNQIQLYLKEIGH